MPDVGKGDPWRDRGRATGVVAMAESARRIGGGLGSDLARRLLAQPIRRHATLSARAVPARLAPVPDIEAETDEDGVAAPELAADLTRQLESQITVMKAVLLAERRENERLRACLDMDDEDALGPEARAVRERWAGLVDRLLHAGA